MGKLEREPRILLLLGSSKTDANRLRDVLQQSHPGVELTQKIEPKALGETLARVSPAVVLSDHRPPDFDAAPVVAEVRTVCPDTPVIIVTDPAHEAAATGLLQAGATDLLSWANLERIGPAISRVFKENYLRKKLDHSELRLQLYRVELERLVQEHALELFFQKENQREELLLSETIRHTLLPKEIAPIVPKTREARENPVRLANLYRPARIPGGDFFRVGRVSDSTVRILMGDVMGRGVRAALVSTLLHSLDQTFDAEPSSPCQLLGRMNRVLCRVGGESDMLIFATGCALQLDLQNATLGFATAGHPPPVRVPADGSCPVALGREIHPGPALGIFKTASYRTRLEKLRDNDRILLFTDGIFNVEDSTGRNLTEAVLMKEIARRARLPLQDTLDSLLNFLQQHSGDQHLADDVCMLGLQIESRPRAA
jgi:sigma-B regulation protein RsbU (phosphoserine phosphatase)